MSDYLFTNYNPFNIYQGYGYGNQTFKGATVSTVSNLRYNNLHKMTQQPDTVTFSAGNQVQGSAKKRKEVCLLLRSGELL